MMDTSVKIINCDSTQTSPEEILSSGEYFSGLIHYDASKNSWIAFNLVNKEKMIYILNEIDFSKGVKIEIRTYAEYPKVIQQENCWRGFN